MANVRIKINAENYTEILKMCFNNIQKLQKTQSKLKTIFSNHQIERVKEILDKIEYVISSNKDTLLNLKDVDEVKKTVNFTYRLVLLISRLDIVLYNIIQNTKDKNFNDIEYDENIIEPKYFEMIDNFKVDLKVTDEQLIKSDNEAGGFDTPDAGGFGGDTFATSGGGGESSGTPGKTSGKTPGEEKNPFS